MNIARFHTAVRPGAIVTVSVDRGNYAPSR